MPENHSAAPDHSLRKRLIVIDIIIPVLFLFTWLGGGWFYAFISIILLVAGWELWRIYTHGGYSHSLVIILLTIFAFTTTRQIWGFQHSDLVLAIFLMVSMAVHVILQQKGVKTSAVDFTITVASGLFLGWMGSYAISLRALPDGMLWCLLVLATVAVADTGGYIFGHLFGKHKIACNVSPNKSWEGYLGGILMGTLFGWGLAALWNLITPGIQPVDGVWLGLVLSILTPLGDFGESMLKRQFTLKDSGNSLPGHGGFLDRIDSSLWAVVIGYYLILFLK